MLLWALVVLFLASVFAAAAPGIDALLVSRLVAGLSLGAYPPLMFAYLTDLLPPARRGGLIVTATAISYIGPPAFIFLVRWLTPIMPLGIEAWRWGFLAAAGGVAACVCGFWWLPESPRWLIHKARFAEAETVLKSFKRSTVITMMPSAQNETGAVGTVVSSGLSTRSLGRQALFLVVLYFLTPWATVGFALLSGAVLVQKGINVQDSLLYIGISTFGPLVGTLAGGFLIERAERRTFLVINAVGMAVAGILFGITSTPLWLVSAALAFNLIVALFLPVLVLYASESVPTENRAKLTSWAWTANRVGSALVPIALLPVLHSFGATAMFVVIAGTLAAFIAMLLVFGSKGSARRRVD
jgi:putative MFS transporter